MKKELNEMTLNELKSVKHREWNDVLNDVKSIIFIPEDDSHDSGYSLISAVCELSNGELIKIGGCSDYFDFNDDIHLGLDILEASKLTRIFITGRETMRVSEDSSSIIITKSLVD